MATMFYAKHCLNLVVGDVFGANLQANLLCFRMERRGQNFEITTEVVHFQPSVELNSNFDRHGDYCVCSGGCGGEVLLCRERDVEELRWRVGKV